MSAELTIDREFSELIPGPSAEELAELEKSLIDEGCRDPIVVWANHEDTILDGYNRYRLCTKNDIPFKTKAMRFETREDAKNWICRVQLGRRNITDATRKYLLGLVYNSAKQEHGGARKPSPHNEDLKTAEKIGEKHDVSSNTVQRAGVFAESIGAIEESAGHEVAQAILAEEVKSTQADVVALAAAPARVIDMAAKKIRSGKAKSVKEAMGKKPRKPKPKLGDGVANFDETYAYIGRAVVRIDTLAEKHNGDKWAARIRRNLNDCLIAIREWKAASRG